MSKKTLRKAYQKELALELRGKKRKNKRTTEDELMQLVADAAARGNY
ncbi:hypothetical protein GECvBMG_gp156 [Salmonella phage GEC_vB_MG]|uniref:Uncharacterized protein 144 n=2 Tax=Seunavirus TaxID=1914851 RepID=G3BM09_9CAUD|nr:hypothetical protein PVP-SE1_gp143 [Salmonella phage PVPSE1]YP_009148979.1 hypothetical protein ACQ19_gp183 [Salmonella phage SSE121]QPI14700.1 hypothetical protein GECvBMG_gp156 [Salmonella phage GEC_vB_MG]UGV21679.1 ribonucleotide reductase of class Ia (aerobic) alpha subunit [Cronobacter phage EspYZU08]WNT48178.1 hypothetical protein SPLA5a_PHROGS00095 [Salmonella phage SPLA5a]ADP02539.1 conserved hypothetical protein [Salmonella phage PVPSE1]AFU63824.1 hypothetical protein [Salmonella 